MIERVCPGFSRLECDQECATLERNRRLAEALQINFLSDPFNARAPSVYSDSLKEDARSVFCTSFIPAVFIVHVNVHCLSSLLRFRKDLKFVTEVEGEIRNLVELANKVTALMSSRVCGAVRPLVELVKSV